MMDTMFELPSSGERKFTVTADYAAAKLEKAKSLAQMKES